MAGCDSTRHKEGQVWSSRVTLITLITLVTHRGSQNGQMEASFSSSAPHKANMEDNNTLQHRLTPTRHQQETFIAQSATGVKKQVKAPQTPLFHTNIGLRLLRNPLKFSSAFLDKICSTAAR